MIENTLAVRLQTVSLFYKTGIKKIAALNNISLQIKAGSITGIMGPDTSGKTTLMRISAGLLVPDQGVVEIFGKPIAKVKNSQANIIGYMPQHFGLYEDLSVSENLNLYANLAGIKQKDKNLLFNKLLKFTGLAPFSARFAGKLSGGMKQKLGIACALLGQPRLLLLDEPGVGVDPRSRRELWNMVQSLAGNGMTILWATSYMDEAAKCPNIIVLEKGSILFSGTPHSLAAKSQGDVYLLPVNKDGLKKREALLKWSMEPGIIDVMINGEYIRLECGGEAASQALEKIKSLGGKPEIPTLGDAYIAAIGGIDKKPSPYMNIEHIGQSKFQHKRIVADNLTKKFGNFTAASHISFTVGAGEIVGLLGPNGAGKSTTFRMLCGLLRPTLGNCSVDGVDMLRASSQARGRLGYMAQNFSLYPDISVWQNLYISARLYGISKKQMHNFGEEMASAMGLESYLHSRTADLSLGMKQRLALLCATIHKPPVLFLDEPTSGVDLHTRKEFWKHISALAKGGTAVLVTTHFLEEAEYCDKIALIYRGVMIKYGTPAALQSETTGLANADMEEAFIACIDQYDKDHPL